MFFRKKSLFRSFRISQNLEPFSYSIVKLMNRDVTIMNTGWTMVSSLLMNSQEIKGGKRIELHCWWTNDLLNEEKERLNKCTQPAMKLIGLRLVVWWHENRKVTLSNWEFYFEITAEIHLVKEQSLLYYWTFEPKRKTTSVNLSLESRTNIFPNIANKEEASLLEPFGLRDWLAFAKRVCVFVGYYHVLTSLLFTFHFVIFRPLVFQRTFEYVGSKSWNQAFLLLVIDSFEDDDFVKKWDNSIR